ncbi:MAG: ABC transporter substrate-binding protein [Hasllibacter sp.]
MRRPVAFGYVPLVDAAPVLVARALGFDADEGLRIEPSAQPSWAALRDLLALGHLEAAHILSPVPVAMRMGLGGMEGALDVLALLSVNGNTVGVSAGRSAAVRAEGWAGFDGDAAAAAPLLEGLRIGVPFAISTHALLLRYLMERTGRPAPDLRAVPPPRMADALDAGEIDAFCVGEPWGSAAVDAGLAEIVLTGRDIWAAAPEKALAVPGGADPGLSAALIRALVRAGDWLARPANLTLAGEILTSGALTLPQPTVERALAGRIVPRRGAAPVAVPGLLRLGGGAAQFPWRSQGAWIGRRLALAHGGDPAAATRTGAAVFRSDLHRAALAGSGADLPSAGAKLEGALERAEPVASAGGRLAIGPDRFFDGAIFDMQAAGAPAD